MQFNLDFKLLTQANKKLCLKFEGISLTKQWIDVQGHSRSTTFVAIESPYMTSYYWLIVT